MEQHLKKQNNYIEYGKRLTEIYSELPIKIIENISEDISQFITQKMRELLRGHGFDRAEFNTEGGIDVIISNNDRIDIRTMSGGEFTVMGLILRIALADFVAKLDFLILDEPTNHLDDERVKEFIEMVDKDNIFEKSAKHEGTSSNIILKIILLGILV